MEELSANYWSKRYVNSDNGWDLGSISLPIKEYIDQLTDTSISILIPGCGNGYEGEYLIEKGFKNVYLLDFALEPLLNFKKNNPNFPSENLINEDFFEHQGNYDLIIEQTLFCAIDPKLRMNYAKKISELLTPKGKLIGLLFNRKFQSGPPFGGSKNEYLTYFTPYFKYVKMEDCYNSIEPRKGTELFISIQFE